MGVTANMLSVPLAGLAQNILTLLNILFSHSLFITYQQVMLYYGVIAMLICTVPGKISLLYHRGGGSWPEIPQLWQKRFLFQPHSWPTCHTWPSAVHHPKQTSLMPFTRWGHIQILTLKFNHEVGSMNLVSSSTTSFEYLLLWFEGSQLHCLIISSCWATVTPVWAISPQNWSLTFS